MASPCHIAAGSGNKENISENEATLVDRGSTSHKQVAFSAKGKKKKPAGFNLRKSIAWNPAFFTEEGVLDTSELSVLAGSELMENGSPSSGGINGCRFGKYDNTHILMQVAEKTPGKLSAKYSRTQNQGRRLFSSAKTPQRDEPKQPVKKLPMSTSTALMSRTPKKHISSIPMVPRSTTPETTVSKSNKKLPPVKTNHIHRAPGLVPKSKINSGPSMETDVVPAVAAIPKETSGSVKLKKSQINHSSFGGTTSTPAKPSALRMPSPSVGFFTQENAQTSHGNTAERNAGRSPAGIISSHGKPPRYKLSEDLKAGLYLSKVLPTNCTTASDLVSLPATTDSNTDTLVTSEKRSLSKIICTYSTKSSDANYQEIPEVYCSIAGRGATAQPLSSEKDDGVTNSSPIVYKDTSCVEGRGTIKEIEPVENSLSLKATCFSTIEATRSSTKATVGSKSSLSCTSSQRNDLSCQSKRDNGSIPSGVGEGTLPISLSEDGCCNLNIDSFQKHDSCNLHNTERDTSVEPKEYTLCADQMPPSGSSSDGKPDLADRKPILNDSLYDEGESALSEEHNNTNGGIELETSKASVVTEDPMLHVGREHDHNFKRTKCSPDKPEAPMTCVERQNVLSVKLNIEDKMVFDSNKLVAQEAASHIEKDKAVDRSRTNTILRDHLKNLVPFTEEWLAVMEACGQEVLEQKSGAVQHSPPNKSAPEPSPWSPVKRKAQDVGPFDCTKYSKSVQTSGTTR